MTDETFFDESREQSRIKSRIVAKYFWAWAKVIIPTAKAHGNRIAYIDLFAGPGQYKDGTVSTPILVLRQSLADRDMRKMLVTVFNDRDPQNVESLREAVDRIPGVEQLTYKPQIEREEVGVEIVKLFQSINLVPSLLFVDPWGYKGLSLALINSVLKNWGCDCVFFFNYNRINMALNNDIVREHMNDLLGEARANLVRKKLQGLQTEEREALIVEELLSALKGGEARFVLPFTFKNEQGTRTTHHLIFVTKHFRGYEIMKEIMAGESSARDQGVPSFAYSVASQRFPTLFALTTPLSDLEAMLVEEFAGQRLKMREVYERHNVGRPFIRANYKRALINLEAAEKIQATPHKEKRRKVKGEATFGDDVIVIFPGKTKR